VLGNRCQTTNLPWVLEGQALASRFGIPTVEIVNDLVALGHGLPLLEASELETLHEGTEDARGNALLVAVGTGLGVALLIREGPGLRPLPSEAGHMDLAARDETEARIVARLAERFGGHVSIERVVSGRGLRNLYETLRSLGVAPESPEVRAALEAGDAGGTGAAIHRAATAGDPLARATFDRFLPWLGATVGNLALASLATGGITLGGGIAPKILDELRRPAFLEALRSKGRFREFLERVPLRVILAAETGLWGAAALAAESARRSSR
jgi:glucokinase